MVGGLLLGVVFTLTTGWYIYMIIDTKKRKKQVEQFINSLYDEEDK